MITYILIGLIWCAWLEWYTTSTNALNGREWTNRERLFNIGLWPWSVAVFVITFIKHLF